MLMSAAEYRESLRRYRPRVYVDGRRIDSVADEPALAPGVNAHRRHVRLRAARRTAPLMRAPGARTAAGRSTGCSRFHAPAPIC